MQNTEMENQILAILKYVTPAYHILICFIHDVCIVTHKSKYAEPHAAFFTQVFRFQFFLLVRIWLNFFLMMTIQNVKSFTVTTSITVNDDNRDMITKKKYNLPQSGVLYSVRLIISLSNIFKMSNTLIEE